MSDEQKQIHKEDAQWVNKYNAPIVPEHMTDEQRKQLAEQLKSIKGTKKGGVILTASYTEAEIQEFIAAALSSERKRLREAVEKQRGYDLKQAESLIAPALKRRHKYRADMGYWFLSLLQENTTTNQQQES